MLDDFAKNNHIKIFFVKWQIIHFDIQKVKRNSAFLTTDLRYISIIKVNCRYFISLVFEKLR